MKVNASFELVVIEQLIKLLKEFKNVFFVTCKNMKGIPPKIVQHIIELDTTIPLAHKVNYQLHPNYFAIIKQDI
jgi:hypothetical protein